MYKRLFVCLLFWDGVRFSSRTIHSGLTLSVLEEKIILGKECYLSKTVILQHP